MKNSMETRNIPTSTLAALAMTLTLGAVAHAAPGAGASPPSVSAPAARAQAPEFPSGGKAQEAFTDGLSLAADGDSAGAIEAFTTTINLEPTFARAHFERGAMRAAGGDANAAINDFGAAAKHAPQASEMRARARFERAALLHSRMEDVASDRDVAEALAINPEFPEALALRAALRNAAGKALLALDDASAAIAMDQGVSLAWLERGRAYESILKPERAIDDLSRAIDLLEDERDMGAVVSALIVRGRCLDSIGRVREAIADFTAAIAREPEAYDAFVGRAISLSRLGRNAEAMSDCERAIAVAPATVTNDSPAHRMLARLRDLRSGGRTENASVPTGRD